MIIAAIQGHADKAERNTLMAKAIYAADELTGLIVAAALVRPDKRLAGLELESVIRRFREPAFARGANRAMIQTCETELGIPLGEFCAIALEAMKGIAAEIGL
jgi:predicted hydrolase (HD superfamily)